MNGSEWNHHLDRGHWQHQLFKFTNMKGMMEKYRIMKISVRATHIGFPEISSIWKSLCVSNTNIPIDKHTKNIDTIAYTWNYTKNKRLPGCLLAVLPSFENPLILLPLYCMTHGWAYFQLGLPMSLASYAQWKYLTCICPSFRFYQ